MKSRLLTALAAFAAAVSLASCSGVKNECTVNCGGGGTPSVSVTLAAVPFVPPPNTSILSFAVTINSVSLTPTSGGSDVNIPLNATTYSVDLTRLQSDSSFLGHVIANVPSGTYNKVTVGVTSAVVTYCTASSGTPGCNTGSVAQNKRRRCTRYHCFFAHLGSQSASWSASPFQLRQRHDRKRDYSSRVRCGSHRGECRDCHSAPACGFDPGGW